MEGVPAPKKALGQHFLHDPSILNRIAAFAGVGEGDMVLEIGPGPGGLTRALAACGARITAIETDPRMVEHLTENGPRLERLITGDALKVDYEALAAEAGGRFKLVSNLPYNISGPLTARLLRQRGAFTSMTLMYQREVAERLAAGTGTRTRGVLSVFSQAFCEVEPGFKLPPGAFKPPPKVESMVIKLTVRETPLVPLKDEELFWKIVHEAFQKRRKQLRNCLKARVTDPESFFASLALTGSERPEELTSEKWLEIANALAG